MKKNGNTNKNVVLTDKDFLPPIDDRYSGDNDSDYYDYKKAYDDFCIENGNWD
nr:MAG TPA: hypothetical protein [Bacteriophage sp.]